jgi:UDP-N-acetylmuramoylalanine--D-glutamate ligase
MMKEWTGKSVLILGAARQGQALARWLARHGALVTLSDSRNETELKSARQSLADLPIKWAFGGHPLELLKNIDTLCLSGGIPLSIPIVIEATNQGIPLSNDTQIFMQQTPCKTVGITGSAGKSTTTMLVGNMAEATFAEKSGRCWVGGNIGDPLINYVDEMAPEDLAILEVSSFQLDQMTISPNIAAVLNVTPNHLDRHGTMEEYTNSKARILDFQHKHDCAILGRDDPGAWALKERVQGVCYSFGMSSLDPDQSGTYASDGLFHLRIENAYMLLPIQNSIHLRGQHNLLNVLAAILIGYAAGLNLDSMLEAIDNFHGMPHRLELVREHNGVKWYNDSIATAPERSIAAIRAFDEPIVLLLGGRDKNLPWDNLSELVRQRVDHVVVFGEAKEKILGALGTSRSDERPYSIQSCSNLQDAVNQAAKIARSGDVILFSPGGTSFDEFRDFSERGDKFKIWVQEL